MENTQNLKQKFVKFTKSALLILLVVGSLSSVSVIYAHSKVWVAEKEKEIQSRQIEQLKQEIEQLKK